jgi:hypothetical protein
MEKEGKEIPTESKFFRKNRNSIEMKIEAKDFHIKIADESQILEYQQDLDFEESCDIYAECGIDN